VFIINDECKINLLYDQQYLSQKLSTARTSVSGHKK